MAEKEKVSMESQSRSEGEELKRARLRLVKAETTGILLT